MTIKMYVFITIKTKTQRYSVRIINNSIIFYVNIILEMYSYQYITYTFKVLKKKKRCN